MSDRYVWIYEEPIEKDGVKIYRTWLFPTAIVGGRIRKYKKKRRKIKSKYKKYKRKLNI